MSNIAAMLRRRTAFGVVISLVAVLLVGLMVAGRTPRHHGQAEEVSSAAPSNCADVLLVGSNGNGESAVASSGFGRTVQAVAGRYAATLGATRTVQTHLVGGRTRSLSVLLRGARRDKVSRLAIRASSVRLWMSEVPTVVSRAVPVLERALARCPAQQLALVGYAQGASVAHRIVRHLAADGLLSRITGVALVSDPERRALSSAHRDGDPPASRAHRGIATQLITRNPDVPAPRGSYSPWELCTRGDLVCDPSNASLRSAIGVASSYVVHGRPDGVLVRAAATLTRWTGAWPVPRQRLVRAAGSAGQSVSVQLSAVASSAAGGVVWRPVGALPSGFALSDSGLLTGTAPAGGVLNIPVSVAGTAPATPSAAARVVITIAGRTTVLSSGGQTTCETRSDLTAWCWGRNDLGQFGTGTTGGSGSPVQVKTTGWTQLSTSGSTTCGIKRNGGLYCWGLNNYGQTGRPISKAVLSPQRIGTVADWRQVAVGWSHACAVRATGQLYCWGQNLRGQLGLGTTGAPHTTPTLVGIGRSWVSVTAAGWHTCGIRRNGSAWCWGDNTFGELGNGTAQRRTRPAQVAGTTHWLSLSASWNDTCGVDPSGGMYCWGRNWSGQLGDGTTRGSAVPMRIGAARLWLTVSAGEGGACALDIDGSPWCWGSNRYGQIGSAAGSTALVPTALATPADQSQLSGAWFSHCSVQVSVSCWGDPSMGQLGTSPVQSRTAPRIAPRPAVTATPDSAREVRRLEAMTPAEVAQHDLAGRPVVTTRTLARSTAPTSFRVMTYNVLGSNHTAPLADAQQYAPARMRAEWESNLITGYRPSLLGTQEPQPDQIGDFSALLGTSYAITPGNSAGYAGAPQSLMFATSSWTKVWSSSISITFVGQTRPQPVVRLRNTATGAEVYFINVHLSPHDRQTERVRAMDILVREIRVLAKDHLPIVLTGDFNQKKWAFCQVTGRTSLKAANGGYHTGSTCVPPRNMRVDWIFASGGRWSGFRMKRGAAVAMTTDHAVQYATYTTGSTG
ncbi:MAG TPA: cutinase family protein [Nocardioides sp.]|nr:cutinase family protein [Nocardioides sp.]